MAGRGGVVWWGNIDERVGGVHKYIMPVTPHNISDGMDRLWRGGGTGPKLVVVCVDSV